MQPRQKGVDTYEGKQYQRHCDDHEPGAFQRGHQLGDLSDLPGYVGRFRSLLGNGAFGQTVDYTQTATHHDADHQQNCP